MSSVNATIVNTARKFLSTPFHLQGRKNQVGIDCLGLIMEVANLMRIPSKAGGLLKDYDFYDYNLNSDYSESLSKLNTHLHLTHELSLGYIAIFTPSSNHLHLGIVGNHPTQNFSLIHACLSRAKVIEHHLSNELIKNIKHIYKFHQIGE